MADQKVKVVSYSLTLGTVMRIPRFTLSADNVRWAESVGLIDDGVFTTRALFNPARALGVGYVRGAPAVHLLVPVDAEPEGVRYFLAVEAGVPVDLSTIRHYVGSSHETMFLHIPNGDVFHVFELHDLESDTRE